MTASPPDGSHREKRKMTVSERSIPALTAALQDWLAGRSAGPGRPTVSGVGNIIYRDFEPAAVLDREMAALGSRELDVGWFVFLHRFFQDIAEFFGVSGLPDFGEDQVPDDPDDYVMHRAGLEKLLAGTYRWD